MGDGFHYRTGTGAESRGAGGSENWGSGNHGGTGSHGGSGNWGSGANGFYGDGDGGEDVYSKVVRAGKRTYFFDVKATRSGDYYLTVTESRKKPGRDGTPVFEKNKIFLYKEDFAKFAGGLEDVVNYVKIKKPEFFENETENGSPDESTIDAEFALL
jgi:hypothetical protein